MTALAQLSARLGVAETIDGFRSGTLTHASRGRQLWTLALVSVGVMLLILWLFSPRYALWSALAVPSLNGYPETNRAYFTLLQLQDPFVEIGNFSNKVIEWRLLFPLLFHYLRLPAPLFLAMPWIGCLLLLWYSANLLWQRTGSMTMVAAGITLLGTTSWFFTSTGWLTYFDSWYVLGGMILAFSPSRLLVLLAAALTPWIDERVLFMLPAALAARAALHWNDTGTLVPDRRQWTLAAAAVLPLVGYVLVRVAAALFFDQGSREYVQAFGTRTYPADPLLRGTWMGLRLAWAPVLALPVLAFARSRLLAAATAVTALVTLAIALVLAGDVSRSMSLLLPLAAAGLVLLYRYHPRAAVATAVLAAGNLLLPASHVVSSFTVPIFNARYEMYHLEHPPQHLDAKFHLSLAVQHYQAGDLEGVNRSLGYARRLTRAPGELALAMVRFGEVEAQQGRPESAAAFYLQALETAPLRWEERSAIEERLRALEATPRAGGGQ